MEHVEPFRISVDERELHDLRLIPNPSSEST
jgi:hypothetical protein